MNTVELSQYFTVACLIGECILEMTFLIFNIEPRAVGSGIGVEGQKFDYFPFILSDIYLMSIFNRIERIIFCTLMSNFSNAYQSDRIKLKLSISLHDVEALQLNSSIIRLEWSKNRMVKKREVYRTRK